MIFGFCSILCAAGLASGAAGEISQEPGSLRVRSYEPSRALGWTQGELVLTSIPGVPDDMIKVRYKGERQGRLQSLSVSTSTWSQELSPSIPSNAVSFPTRAVVSARAAEGSAIDTISLSLPVLVTGE